MLKPIHLPFDIKASRVTARQITVEMAEELFKVIDGSRKHLREFLYWVDGVQVWADEQAAIEMFLENWNNGSGFAYALFDEQEQIIGTVDVHNISYKDNFASFGYWIKKSATGKGYLAEILPEIEQEFFKAGLHRMVIECVVENIPSAHVAIRGGYSFEGIAKERIYGYGQYQDTKVFAKLAS